MRALTVFNCELREGNKDKVQQRRSRVWEIVRFIGRETEKVAGFDDGLKG